MIGRNLSRVECTRLQRVSPGQLLMTGWHGEPLMLQSWEADGPGYEARIVRLSLSTWMGWVRSSSSSSARLDRRSDNTLELTPAQADVRVGTGATPTRRRDN
jgi:hypothetical protein